MKNSKILSGLMGVCVGDALGFPVQFAPRQARVYAPVTGMTGHPLWKWPAGFWSDDSSLTLCLAEALCGGFDLEAIAHNFVRWRYDGYWTPFGQAFDVGGTTNKAISRLKDGIPPTGSGGTGEWSNGNGSLMRILPMAFRYQTVDFPELIEEVHLCSSITHAHLRSQMGCGIYISIAICLLEGLEPKAAYLEGIERVKPIYAEEKYSVDLPLFDRVFNGDIETLPMDAISSSTYVIHTLEAALWCLLTTSSFSEALLKAVNLGDDTDSVGAVTGGLAGIYYGFDNIPSEWLEVIARKDDIMELAKRLEAVYG
jgi:ADP-ribosylglycohydrolase